MFPSYGGFRQLVELLPTHQGADHDRQPPESPTAHAASFLE